MRDVLVMVVIENVGEHQRRPRQPRQTPQRRHVGLHDEIAVALLPVGGRVAGHRLHVDVVGEQIVAAVGLLVRPLEEILGLHALADQAPLHVGKGDDDGIDLAVADRRLQFLERQHARHDRNHFCWIDARSARRGADRAKG